MQLVDEGKRNLPTPCVPYRHEEHEYLIMCDASWAQPHLPHAVFSNAPGIAGAQVNTEETPSEEKS